LESEVSLRAFVFASHLLPPHTRRKRIRTISKSITVAGWRKMPGAGSSGIEPPEEPIYRSPTDRPSGHARRRPCSGQRHRTLEGETGSRDRRLCIRCEGWWDREHHVTLVPQSSGIHISSLSSIRWRVLLASASSWRSPRAGGQSWLLKGWTGQRGHCATGCWVAGSRLEAGCCSTWNTRMHPRTRLRITSAIGKRRLGKFTRSHPLRSCSDLRDSRVCPACLHQWTETQCLSCSSWSWHSERYG
jgi:hypothetical protein